MWKDNIFILLKQKYVCVLRMYTYVINILVHNTYYKSYIYT